MVVSGKYRPEACRIAGSIPLPASRVRLRPLTRECIREFGDLLGVDSLVPAAGLPRPQTRHDADAWLTACDEAKLTRHVITWMVVNQDGRAVGTVRSKPWKGVLHQRQLSYWIAPRERRLGYGTAALSALLTAPLPPMENYVPTANQWLAFVQPHNTPSICLLRGAGFTRSPEVHHKRIAGADLLDGPQKLWRFELSTSLRTGELHGS